MVAVASASNLLDLFPDEPRHAVRRAFDTMEIAEEEIAAAIRRCPRKRKQIDAAFKYLSPGPLGRYGDDVYRHHVREIIGRIFRGEDLEPGTDAEVLAVLSEQSLKAPLSGPFAFAMTRMFRTIFPKKDFGTAGHESYAGEVDTIIADIRRLAKRPGGRALP